MIKINLQSIVKIICLAVLVIPFSNKTKAQSKEGFIYGKVVSKSGNTYEGAIRWGKEEVYWFDYFNGTQTSNESDFFVDKRKNKGKDEGESIYIGDIKINISGRNSYYSNNHKFSTEFGYIKRLERLSNSNVELELQNGKRVEVSNGSNDFGARIQISDNELGKVKLKWSDLDYVEFSATPKNMDNSFGEPLYGTVTTIDGEFTGFIQWDHDERISTDVLDGETDESDLSIEFGKIKTIARDGRGAEVYLKSGRKLFLSGSNDVNSGNRGIIVNIPELGRVDIPWKEFRKVTFEEEPKGLMPTYANYDDIFRLKGIVTTRDDDQFSGAIYYDLDEYNSYDVLEGEKFYVEYTIPFRNIEKISREGSSFTIVKLKNGKKYDLSGSRDVNHDNDGILVVEGKNKAELVKWKDLKEVQF